MRLVVYVHRVYEREIAESVATDGMLKEPCSEIERIVSRDVLLEKDALAIVRRLGQNTRSLGRFMIIFMQVVVLRTSISSSRRTLFRKLHTLRGDVANFATTTGADVMSQHARS